MAGPYLAEKYRTYATWGQDEVLPGNDSFRQPFEALLRDRFVLGSPEECYEQLRSCWEEAGANFLIFRTHWSGMPVGHALASMRLISDELLPACDASRRRAAPTEAGGHAPGGKKTTVRTSMLSRGGALAGVSGSSKPVCAENRCGPVSAESKQRISTASSGSIFGK
jgi:hypothetical protein